MTHLFQITDQGHIRYKAICTNSSSGSLFPLSHRAFPSFFSPHLCSVIVWVFIYAREVETTKTAGMCLSKYTLLGVSVALCGNEDY